MLTHTQPLAPKEQLRRNTIQQRIAAIGTELHNLVSSIAQGGPAMARYLNARLEELDQEKSGLLKELRDLEEQGFLNDSRLQVLLQICERIDSIPNILNGNDFDDIRSTCALLVKDIFFQADGSVEISYTI